MGQIKEEKIPCVNGGIQETGTVIFTVKSPLLCV